MSKAPPNTFTPVSFDTLKVYEDLQAAGLEPDAARAVVETMARAHANRGATVADLREVEHRLDLHIAELERKFEVQGARNRVGVSSVRKEAAEIRKDITRGLARLTWSLIILFVLVGALIALAPHLPEFWEALGTRHGPF